MRVWPLLVFGCLALASEAPPDAGTSAQPISIKAEVSPRQVQLGQPFYYQVTITHAKNQRWDLKTPGQLGPFEWLEQTRKRADDSSSATTVFRIKAALFELGDRKLPDLSFEVTSETGVARYPLPGADIEAVSILSEAEQKGTELKDIKPPEALPIRSYRALWVALAIVAAGGLAYAAYRWLHRSKVPMAPILPPRPPEIVALAALDGLQAEDLPGQGRVREFYFRLSEIVRAYLGQRYSFEALECTSPELLEAMRIRPGPLKLAELERFTAQSDFVKFAKGQLSPAECKDSLAYAYSLVCQTSMVTPKPADAVRPDIP